MYASRRSRGVVALAGVFAALAAALMVVLPASTASASTVWGGSTPRWVARQCRTGTVICIDKSVFRLAFMKAGKAVLILDTRFGSASNPTREGVFKVYYKDAHHVSGMYGSKMPWSMFFSGGEAIHYSSDFARYGYAHHSHGCVNTRDWSGVEWLYNHTPLGTKVVVYH